MKTLLTTAALLCLLQAGPVQVEPVQTQFLAYRSPVMMPAQTGVQPAGRTCAVLPADVFAHASPTLADLRLVAGGTPVPYVITESQSSLQPAEPARVLNLGMVGKAISFDLAMPARPYTEVRLQLTGTDFLASAHVTGLNAQTPGVAPVSLGTFTLFDLSGQHLSRSTTLPLQESRFPLLHIALDVTPAPGSHFQPSPAMVIGAEVPPNRDAQILYTRVAATSEFAEGPRVTVANLLLPAHVPVEAIRFELKPGSTANFSRHVTVRATPAGNDLQAAPFQPEVLTGEISRVHLAAGAGRALPVEEQSLTVPATLGANLREPVRVEITVANGDDRPVPLAAVELAMRERKLCFDAPAGNAPLALFFGDPTLAPPVYDYAALFNPADPAGAATLGPVMDNPGYTPRPAARRPFTERHPEVLWLALLAVVGALGLVAFRQSRTTFAGSETDHHG